MKLFASTPLAMGRYSVTVIASCGHAVLMHFPHPGVARDPRRQPPLCEDCARSRRALQRLADEYRREERWAEVQAGGLPVAKRYEATAAVPRDQYTGLVDLDALKRHLGLDRWPSGWRKALLRQQALREERQERQVVSDPLLTTTLRERATRRAEERRQAVETCIASLVREAWGECGYRQSESSWAGGDHEVRVRVIAPGELFRPDAGGWADKVWSSNGKWSGSDSTHSITVRSDWESEVFNRGLAVVDGLFTLDATPVAPPPSVAGDVVELYDATWAVQSRGVAVRSERGLIAVSDEGWRFHATSPRALRRAYNSRARQEADAEVARLSRSADAEAFLARLEPGECHLEVTPADSDAAGNCSTGSRDWTARHFPGRTTATVEEVVRVAYHTGDRVRFAVAAALAAVRRHRHANVA